MTLKAIETIYKGYKFRSRLEARWAVFFDALEVKWEYEPEGYELGSDGRYLPDFWLPDDRIWVEVKGVEPDQSYIDKLGRFSDGIACAILLVVGLPLENPVRSHAWYCLEDAISKQRTFEGLWRENDLVYVHPSQWAHPVFNVEGAAFGRDGYLATTEKSQKKAALKAKQARFEHGERP